MLDRRVTRHGMSIKTGRDKNEDYYKSNVFHTVVVTEFVSNPIEYLSEEIDIIQTSSNFRETKKKRRSGGLRKFLNERRKLEKFNKIKEKLPLEEVINKKREAKAKVKETIDSLKAQIQEMLADLGDRFNIENFINQQGNIKQEKSNKLMMLINKKSKAKLSESEEFDFRELRVPRLEGLTLEGSSERVKNPELVPLMPRNSIIGIKISDINANREPEVFFPFFPNHFSLPVKPGEHIWVFYENIQGRRVGYWMHRSSYFTCRKLKLYTP